MCSSQLIEGSSREDLDRAQQSPRKLPSGRSGCAVQRYLLRPSHGGPKGHAGVLDGGLSPRSEGPDLFPPRRMSAQEGPLNTRLVGANPRRRERRSDGSGAIGCPWIRLRSRCLRGPGSARIYAQDNAPHPIRRLVGLQFGLRARRAESDTYRGHPDNGPFHCLAGHAAQPSPQDTLPAANRAPKLFTSSVHARRKSHRPRKFRAQDRSSAPAQQVARRAPKERYELARPAAT